MKKINRKLKTRLKIVGATVTAIFSLFSVFTATYAWFSTNQSTTVSGASVTVKVPDSIGYDMYYLASFTDSESQTQNGNYNSTTSIFSGYDAAYVSATFTKINFTDGVVTDNPNPLSISHLWPAHKLTFAIVITSSTISKFSITNWSEGATAGLSVIPKTGATQNVCLSWAIDVYGAAYSVQGTGANNAITASDVAGAYGSNYHTPSTTHALTDAFDYSEGDLNPDVPPLDVVDTVPANASGYSTVLFFSIEFSNATSTFYKFNKTTTYYERYVSGDTTGFNSNCYEGLELTGMEFSLS